MHALKATLASHQANENYIHEKHLLFNTRPRRINIIHNVRHVELC